ncbi:hypothetical protein HD806DRAFT_74019 [Xylariaceae sp. AK1471]|nr:hypothetical protein HD806DRAFT_74019 [Xylariaceae sp. AK1471]
MSRFLTAATLFTAAQALAFGANPARATDAVIPDTTFYRPEITEGPSIKELMKRAGDTTVLVAPDNTCGYVSGRAGAAYTCGEDYTCGFVIQEGFGAVGCCTGSVCGLRATCLDYQDIYSSSACDDGCLQDTFTAKCTSTGFPYCGTVTFFSGVRDYYCDSLSISTKQQLYTTYIGETDGRVWQEVVYTSDESATASASGGDNEFSFNLESTTRPTTSPSASSSSDPDNNNNNNNNNNTGGGNNPPAKKSSTPIGPIVGGVVGGVAVIALIGLAIFFIIRHNKKKGAAAAVTPAPAPHPEQPMQQMAAAPGSPGPPGYPQQQQQGYNNGYAQQPYSPQQGTPPQGYYSGQPDQKPAGFVGLTPVGVPDRHDSTSPVSQFSDTRYSTQPPPHSPTSTLNSNWGPQSQPTPPSVPPTVHEVGGNVVGERDLNANHRGQFHELG